MPQAWRTIQVLEGLNAQMQDPLSLSDLMTTYKVQVREDKWCTLMLKRGRPPLVEKAGSTNDKGWCLRFTFVKKSSLDSFVDWLPEQWRHEEIRNGLIKPNSRSVAKVKEFLKTYSTNDRTFVHPCSESTVEEEAEEEDEFEKEVKETSSVTTTHSEEENMASGVTSSKTKGGKLSMLEMYEHASKKEKLNTCPTEVQILDTKPIVTRSPPPKFEKGDSTRSFMPRSHDLQLQLPIDFLAETSNAASIWPAAERLFLPAPKKRLEKMTPSEVVSDVVNLQLHSLQDLLATKNHLISYEEDAKASKASLVVVCDRATTAVAKLVSLMASAAKDEANRKKKMIELELQLHDACEDAKDSKCLDILTGRARVLKSFLDGHLTTEDAQAELDKFLAGLGTEVDLVFEEVAMEEHRSTAESAVAVLVDQDATQANPINNEEDVE